MPIDLSKYHDEQETEQQSLDLSGYHETSEPEIPEESGFFANVLAGAGERIGDLAGAFVQTIETVGKGIEEKVGLGGFVWDDDDILPSYKSAKDFAAEKAPSVFSKGANALKGIDLGYEESSNWESVKKEFSEGGALSGSAYAEVIKYGVEQGIKSTPDMVAVVFALPAYIFARSGEIGEQRAKNKGKPQAELIDILEAAPAAAASALLERIGAKGMTAGVKEELGKDMLKAGVKEAAKRVTKAGGKAMTKEATTEAVQEGMIEYVGERYGTDAKMDFLEALDTAAGAAVAGGVFGGGVSTSVGAVTEITRPTSDKTKQELNKTINDIDAATTTDDVIDIAEKKIMDDIAKHEQGAQAQDKIRIQTELDLERAKVLEKQVQQEKKIKEGDAQAKMDAEAQAKKDVAAKKEQETDDIRTQVRLDFEKQKQEAADAKQAASELEEARVQKEVQILEKARVRSAEEVREREKTRPTEALISDLTISPDLPQFKAGADKEGIVEALPGKFERTGMGPIQVWVRKDGRKEIITGRHRFDLAKRSGETTIPVQYHIEAEGFDLKQARALDATLNIREGQGQVKDYVTFIKDTKMTEKQAIEEGIAGDLARSTGKSAFAIATKGSDLLIDAHRSDAVPEISDKAAVAIAEGAPNNESLQMVAIQARGEGKTITESVNIMKAVSGLTTEKQQQGDLFGGDPEGSALMAQAKTLAKKASAKQAEIQRTLSAIKGASKDPKRAAKEGIDVKDPEAVQRRIAELTEEKRKWSQWHTDPNLIKELKGEIEPDLFEGDAIAETDAERALAKEVIEPRVVEIVEIDRKVIESFNTATDAVNWVAENAKEPVMKELARKIQPFISSSTKIVMTGDGRNEQGVTKGQFVFGGRYNANKIEIADQGMTEETVVHELIHAATAFAIMNPQTGAQVEARQNVMNIMNEVFELIGRDPGQFEKFTSRQQGSIRAVGRSVEEFVSHSLTNPNFQFILKNIKTKRTTGSIFTRLGDAIKKLLGLESIPNDVFTRAIEASTSVIEAVEEAPISPTGVAKTFDQMPAYDAYRMQLAPGEMPSKEGFDKFMGRMKTAFNKRSEELPEGTIEGDEDFAQFVQTQGGKEIPLSDIRLTRKVKGKDGKMKVAQVRADVVLRQTRKKRAVALKLLGCVNGS